MLYLVLSYSFSQRMKLILSTIFLLLATFAVAQAPKCSDFKNGKFVIRNAETGNSYIEREGDRQLEYGEGSGLRLSFEINWIDNCTYTLTKMKVLANPEGFSIPANLEFTIKIIEVKENAYIQETHTNLFEKVLTSEVQRVEE